ncbi:hypothetical protein ACOMHN_033359 [Nucella lapillus]
MRMRWGVISSQASPSAPDVSGYKAGLHMTISQNDAAPESSEPANQPANQPTNQTDWPEEESAGQVSKASETRGSALEVSPANPP